jgi:hypothetical protein
MSVKKNLFVEKANISKANFKEEVFMKEKPL